MDKSILSEYRSKKAEIRELRYNLQNRWKSERLIGNNVILDYTKGYPIPQSIVGFDYKEYERLQDRDLRRKEQLEKECKYIEDWVEAIPDSLTRRIFRMTYIDGRKQREVARAVNLDRSRISRRIDQYLKENENVKMQSLRNKVLGD